MYKRQGLGGDGTVGANKNSTKIIGDHTDKYLSVSYTHLDVYKRQILVYRRKRQQNCMR